MDGPGFESPWRQRLLTSPKCEERLWGPPSLLFIEFRGSVSGRGAILTANRHQVLGSITKGDISSSLPVAWKRTTLRSINPLTPELNPICCLLALLGAHHFLHVSRIRVKLLTFRLIMSYIYIYIYIWSTHS